MRVPFSRPTWAEIDLSALRHNVQTLARVACTPLLAVCKANAYGHDIRLVAPALDALPEIAMLGVASVDEGQALRELGIAKPILLLSAMLPEEARTAVRARLTPTIWTRELGLSLQQAAEKEGARADYHFKVDTGMGRLGARFETAPEKFAALQSLDRLDLRGVYTHMASADEEDDDLTPLQLRRFAGVLGAVKVPPGALIHAANSATILRYPAAHFDMVRAGIALYGSNPLPTMPGELRPVMTWKARVTHLYTVPSGASVSYGATWKATTPALIAVVSVGYADGFRRSLSNRAKILINGVRCPVVGRVTMDQTMVNVSGVAVYLGDEATLFGRGLPIEEMAREADTIAYEILCGVSARVPRVATSSG